MRRKMGEWTDDELAILRRSFARREPMHEIARLLVRRQTEVAQKASELRLRATLGEQLRQES